MLERAWRFPLHCVREAGDGLEVCVFAPSADSDQRGRLVTYRLGGAIRDGDAWVADRVEPAASALQVIEAGQVGLEAGTVVRRLALEQPGAPARD